MAGMKDLQLFDEWPDRYEQWFATPIGRIVRQVESHLVLDLVRPATGELLLDVGCGTGVFTTDFIAAGVNAVGLDISHPMLKYALKKTSGISFSAVQGDMCKLPFGDGLFDKAVSITALEFVEDAGSALGELFRVTKAGGYVVVATLNSLSPWAERRKDKTMTGQRHILENAHYRSGDELLALSLYSGISETAVHFDKSEDPGMALVIEESGRRQRLKTGAFVAVRWQKPNDA